MLIKNWIAYACFNYNENVLPNGHITSFFSFMYSQDNSWFFSDLSGKIREHLPMINPLCVPNIKHPSTLFKHLYPFWSINKSCIKANYEEINCFIMMQRHHCSIGSIQYYHNFLNHLQNLFITYIRLEYK